MELALWHSAIQRRREGDRINIYIYIYIYIYIIYTYIHIYRPGCPKITDCVCAVNRKRWSQSNTSSPAVQITQKSRPTSLQNLNLNIQYLMKLKTTREFHCVLIYVLGEEEDGTL